MKCPVCLSENTATQRYCGQCGSLLLPTKNPTTTAPTLGIPGEELTPGSRFAGRYQIIEELGRGGMGKIYRAIDLKLREEVALKVIKPEIASNKETIARFGNELKLARKISHKNVGRMYELMEDDGTHYITMEYIPGQDLKRLIRQSGRLTAETAVSIARQVAEGLAEAHRLSVVHRDLKPGNILVDRDGRVKILDFGIALSLLTRNTTDEGMIIGTLEYMPPEQVEGRPIDARADVFAFGCVLYEMLTGRSAFSRETTTHTIAAVLNEDPPRVSDAGVDVPDQLQVIISRCLEKNPERRYASMEEVVSLLSSIEMRSTDRARETREHSIAVLPFLNMSSDQENEYFSDGLTEELINSLLKIDGLNVISRTSSFAFKGTNLDVRQIADKLNVGTILEGSVRKSGNRLRITAQLIKASNGFHLYAETFDRELRDVFAIQNELSQSIAKALRLVLTTQARESLSHFPTVSIEAYDYVLRGRQLFYQFQKSGFERALKLFLHATDLDPRYASAYAWAANCYSLLYTWFDPEPHHLEAAEQYSAKALALNPELCEAHVAQGMALYNRKEFDKSAEEFAVATRLKPDSFEATYLYARLCFAQGEYEKSAELSRQASRLRPDDYNAPGLLGMIYTDMNMPAEAQQAYRESLEAARQALELFSDDTRALYMGAVAAIRLGEMQVGLAWTERVWSSRPRDTMTLYGVACCYSLLGQTEKALESIEEAIQYGAIQRKWLEHDPDLQPIREHHRFVALLARL